LRNNIIFNNKFLVSFIFISLGPLNTFSLLIYKILESVFTVGGIRLNLLVMKLGGHLISNFYRQLKKQTKKQRI